MERSTVVSRIVLAAATAGVLVAAGLGSAAPYDYPQGDYSVIALFPESAVYYGYTYLQDTPGSSYYNAYDTEDRIVSTVMLRSNGTIMAHTNRYYDAVGNEAVVEYIDHDTGEVKRSECFYNADGNLERGVHTEQLTGETRLVEYVYDEQDRMIWRSMDYGDGESYITSVQHETLDNGGWIENSETIHDGAEGRLSTLVQHLEYDVQGNLVYSRTINTMAEDQIYELWYRYEYDADGNTVYYANLKGPDGPISFEVASVYTNGQLLEQTSVTPKQDGTELVIHSIYTYNKYGHKVLAEEWHNTDGETREIITDYYLT